MTTPQIRHCANALQVSALLYPNEFGLNTSALSVDRSHECFPVEPICAPLLPPDNASDTQSAVVSSQTVSNRAIAETTRIPSAYPLHPAPLSNDMSNGDGIGRRGRRRTNRSRGYHHRHHYSSANANQHLSAYPHTGTVNYFEQPVSSDQQVFRIIDINPLYQKRLQANSSVFDYMTVNDGGHIHDESSYDEARHPRHHHRRRLPRVRSSNEMSSSTHYNSTIPAITSNPEHHYTDTAILPTLDHLNASNINLASLGTRLPSPLDMPSLYENRTTRKQKRVKRLFQWISSVIRRKKRQQ